MGHVQITREGLRTRGCLIRAAQGLTLKDLSQKTGISANTLGQYEIGNTIPLLDNAEAVKRALHYEGHVEDLFRLVDVKEYRNGK